jgi:hypothetical protein
MVQFITSFIIPFADIALGQAYLYGRIGNSHATLLCYQHRFLARVLWYVLLKDSAKLSLIVPLQTFRSSSLFDLCGRWLLL